MKTSSGFSLIELIFVLVIGGIVAATAIPRLSPTVYTVAAQAEQLASDMRYAQALAMTQGKRYLIVGPTANSYQIQDASGTPVANPLTGTTAAVPLTATLSATNIPNGFIAFDGRGTPYIDATSPGTPLAAVATITLNINGTTRDVTIQPGTGRIDVP